MPLDGPVVDASVPSPPKRQARGERRIARIVGAAEGLIAEAGVRSVGMNAVARRAGISPGSLYRYFPGRDAVLQEVSRRLVARLRGAVEGEDAFRLRTRPVRARRHRRPAARRGGGRRAGAPGPSRPDRGGGPGGARHPAPGHRASLPGPGATRETT
ncbi:TetR/AcrR family transcriptional regulator [Streptomyces filamentosus]